MLHRASPKAPQLNAGMHTYPVDLPWPPAAMPTRPGTCPESLAPTNRTAEPLCMHACTGRVCAPAGIAAVLLLMLNALRGMHAKLAQFLQEVTSDDQLGPGGVAVWKGTAKGD